MALARGLAAPAPVRAAAPGAGLGRGQTDRGSRAARCRGCGAAGGRTAAVKVGAPGRCRRPVAPRDVVAGCGASSARVAAGLGRRGVQRGARSWGAGFGPAARGRRVEQGAGLRAVPLPLAAGGAVGRARGSGRAAGLRPPARRDGGPPRSPRERRVGGARAGAGAGCPIRPPGAELVPQLRAARRRDARRPPALPFAGPAFTCRPLGGVSFAPPIRRRRLGSAQRGSSTSTADGSPANEAPQQARSFGRARLPSRGRWVRIFATGRLLPCTVNHCLWPTLTAA